MTNPADVSFASSRVREFALYCSRSRPREVNNLLCVEAPVGVAEEQPQHPLLDVGEQRVADGAAGERFV